MKNDNMNMVNLPSPQPNPAEECRQIPESLNTQQYLPENNMHIPQLYIKPRAVYSPSDRIFSAAALLLGFAAIKLFLNMRDGLGLMAAVLCLGLMLFNYFYTKKHQLFGTKENRIIFITSIILSLMFIVTDNNYVKSINILLLFVSNAYYAYSSYKSNNDSIIFNVFKSVFISPFYEYGSLFEALFQKTKKPQSKKAEMKNILPIILGVVFSIPVCFVVMSLLMSSDRNFGTGLDKFLSEFGEWFFNEFFGNVIQFCFSLPIAMYIFSAVFSRAYKMNHENELKKIPKTNMRILPSSMCISFLMPLMLLYLAFVFTQISYLFTTYGTANDTFDYADYARSGFFELCGVTLINLTIISVIVFFVKLINKDLPKTVKVFVVLFSFLTLCLIVTALVKMFMYINMFGMTPLRVYTSVFMVYLFLMFIIMIAKQFVYKISFTKIAYIAAAVVLIAMSVLPVDGMIAKYNIKMYNNNKIGWMGYEAMEQLDASAVNVFAEIDPEFCLEDYTGEGDTYPYPMKEYFKNSDVILGKVNIYSFNLTKLFAVQKANDYKENIN